MRNALRISPAPFKSSFLSIPPSPFSPRTPLTPAVPLRHEVREASQQISTTNSKSAVHAPSSPVAWVWKCHQCNHDYRLGVTNRCLEDGHYYCSGTTPLKAWRKTKNSRHIKRHAACTSEFDYSAWRNWGRWRRGGPGNKDTPGTGPAAGSEDHTSTKPKKDCWNMCDYPSECGWGKKFGIHTPLKTCFSTLEADTMSTPTASVNATSEDTPKAEDLKVTKTSGIGILPGFWAALAVSMSIQRKKSDSQATSSPLSTVTQEKTERAVAANTQSPARYRDKSAGTTVTESSFSDNSPASSTPEGPAKPLLSRTRYRRAKSAFPKSHSYIDVRCATGIFTLSANQELSLRQTGGFGSGFESLGKAPSWQNGAQYSSCIV